MKVEKADATFIMILNLWLVIWRERELQVVTKTKRRPPLRRGRVSPRLPVPDHIPRPPYVGSNILPEISSEHQFHDSEGIAHMRAACELAARVLNYAGTLVRVRFPPSSVPICHHLSHVHLLLWDGDHCNFLMIFSS